uniref:Uncharacterized protein n=1 Tax=Magallana gigas TaxID=29159 RepID=K1Q824_MAGGI
MDCLKIPSQWCHLTGAHVKYPSHVQRVVISVWPAQSRKQPTTSEQHLRKQPYQLSLKGLVPRPRSHPPQTTTAAFEEDSCCKKGTL